MGDPEYLYNTSYLELNMDKLWWLIALPYLTPIFSIDYLPFMGAWAILYYLISSLVHFGDYESQTEMF